MTTEGTTRKLTAILSADVKDYTRLMGQDEVYTIRTLTAHREVISNFVQQRLHFSTWGSVNSKMPL